MEKLFYVGSEVLTAVITEGSVFRDVTLHSTEKVIQHFTGIYHVQGYGEAKQKTSMK
jgi:hypothetical protein